MVPRAMLAVLVTVGGCIAQVPAPARPGWIETLPEAPGKLYALGTASLGGNEGEAINRASDRARLELAARLRATVRGSTSVTTRSSELQREGLKSVGSQDRQVRDEVSVGAKAEDLPGLAVERTFSDPSGRTVYALACLDLGQAQSTLAARLDQLRERRIRIGAELSLRARWRLRTLQADLARLDESIGLLALTGTGLGLRPQLQSERVLVADRLAQMEGKALPALDLAKTTVALRVNVDLPPAIVAYLEAQIRECGLLNRNLDPDLVLELSFAGGTQGPELIAADMDLYQGIRYRIEARMTILDGEGGTALTRPVPLQLIQYGSPEGMINDFRRLFERRLPRLIAEVQAELR